MTIVTEKLLDELLDYIEKSMINLAKESIENIEMEGRSKEMKNFLSNQFDIRFENLLASKKSSTHHLESGMKNKTIQRKQRILQKISKIHNI